MVAKAREIAERTRKTGANGAWGEADTLFTLFSFTVSLGAERAKAAFLVTIFLCFLLALTFFFLVLWLYGGLRCFCCET